MNIEKYTNYLTIDNPQYWQGDGIANTDYDYCFIGVGCNSDDAIEDCLDIMAQSIDTPEEMEEMEDTIIWSKCEMNYCDAEMSRYITMDNDTEMQVYAVLKVKIGE